MMSKVKTPLDSCVMTFERIIPSNDTLSSDVIVYRLDEESLKLVREKYKPEPPAPYYAYRKKRGVKKW